MSNEGYYEEFRIKNLNGSFTTFRVFIPEEYVKANNNSDKVKLNVESLKLRIYKEQLKLDNPEFIKKAPIEIIKKQELKLKSLKEELLLINKTND